MMRLKRCCLFVILLALVVFACACRGKNDSASPSAGSSVSSQAPGVSSSKEASGAQPGDGETGSRFTSGEADISLSTESKASIPAASGGSTAVSDQQDAATSSKTETSKVNSTSTGGSSSEPERINEWEGPY